jgi:hypothetical protein
VRISNSRWVHIDVDRIEQETDAAFLLDIDGEEIWVPKSQVADARDYVKGDENVSMSITEWIARQKGLEGE